MRLDLVQHMRQEMSMRLAPQIIQSIEILQLPLMELVQEVKSQLETNPVLEEVGAGNDAEAPVGEAPDPVDGPAESSAESAAAPEPAAPTAESPSEEFRFEDQYGDWDRYGDMPRRRYDGEDKKQEAMLNTAARPQTLQDHLFEQFMLLDPDDDTTQIAEAIIYNLNDDGYLQYPLEEVVAPLGHDITLERAEAALNMVQQLDPPGVGARSLKECLLLQLGGSDAYAFERLLVENHLEDIQKNKLPKICKDTGRSMDEVKEAMKLICHLDPAPGARFSSDKSASIDPDILVDEIEGEYIVRLNDGILPHLEINRRYQEILNNRNGDKSTKEFVRRKIEAAKWLIESIHQRKTTILRVAEAVVRHQREFLDDGVEKLRPLKMQEIADELGIHVSTVSRAVGGKYILTPRGMFPLKHFFSGGMVLKDMAGGASDTKSTLSVQQMVSEMIGQEDKRRPLSDDDIMNQLKERGLDIARRTITKYRKAMRIPSSRQRRAY